MRTLRRRLREEQSGFTMVELLVVTIIIGILAALALALLTGERSKAQDSSTKSDVGGLVAEMEACHVEKDDFKDCDTDAELEGGIPSMDDSVRDGSNTECTDPGFATPPAIGMVGVLASNDNCFVVAGTSESDDGGASHVFMAIRSPEGVRSRLCGPTAPVDVRGRGACGPDGTW